MKKFVYHDVLVEKEYTWLEGPYEDKSDEVTIPDPIPLEISHIHDEFILIGRAINYRKTESGVHFTLISDVDVSGLYPTIRFLVYKRGAHDKPLSGRIISVLCRREKNVDLSILPIPKHNDLI